jgi:formate C-acetyltransferase
VLATESYRAHEMDQVVLKRAWMLDNVLRNMTLYADPDALLLGNQAGATAPRPFSPNTRWTGWSASWIRSTGATATASPLPRKTSASSARKSTPTGRAAPSRTRATPRSPTRARLFYDLGIIKTEGNITSGDAHIAVDYGRALREGLEGARARTEAQLAALKLYQFEDLKKSYFYRAILIALDAVRLTRCALRNWPRAEAEKAFPERAAELREMARICRKVPMRPAETFTRRCRACGCCT